MPILLLEIQIRNLKWIIIFPKNRFQMCVMECNDKIKDEIGPNPTQSDVDKLSDEFEKCATACVDTYCDLLPALEKTMKKVLASKKFD